MKVGLPSMGKHYTAAKDGTKTWTPLFNVKQIKELQGKEIKITQLEFKTPKIGWALMANSNAPITDVYLYKTTDGGASWKLVDFQLETQTYWFKDLT